MDKPRVLIVDDDPLALAVLGREFQNCGVKAEIASSAIDAQLELARRHYDIVMLDLIMPGIDGASVAEAERASGETDTTFIAISGASPETVKRMISPGVFDRFEPKPVKAQFIRDVVDHWTESHSI